jgi:biopolymer transport protein ExbB
MHFRRPAVVGPKNKVYFFAGETFMFRACASSRWALLGSWLLMVAVIGGGLATTVFAPAPAVAQDEAAPADAAAEDEAPPQESYLVWTYKALGLRYTIAFLAISFSFVALIVMIILSLRRDNIVPAHLVESFEAHLNEKRYQEAYELAKNDESFLGQVLSAGLQRLSQGYEHAIEAMQEVGEEETMKLEHRLSYIAMIGGLAPMVGLLGTVDGMVIAFSAIARSTTTPKPSELAGGICMALVTTLVGLVIAIPAIMFLGYMKNRLARMTLEVGIISEGLMSRFDTKK